MSQIFHRSTNSLAKVTLIGVLLFVGVAIALTGVLWQSPYVTQQGVVREQPVPFSHEHHVRGLGIDCRYCHTSVESSSFAGLPSTKTCMTCHSQIWTNAELLEPVRAAYRSNQPIHWTRVHNLPDYVYFDHHIHIAKGVACTTCHGPVERMPLMYQHASLRMSWCLDCHRHPEQYVGPKEQVFKTNWTQRTQLADAGSTASIEMENPGTPVRFGPDRSSGEQFVSEYHIKNRTKLTDCYTCHR